MNLVGIMRVLILGRNTVKRNIRKFKTGGADAQEIVMLILATALLAHERVRAAAGKRPVLQLSFLKCLALLRPLWLTLCLAREVLAPAAKRALCRVFDREIRRCLKPKRRAHSRICGW
jgi:hypothetical protein